MHGGTFAGYARRQEDASSRPALVALLLVALLLAELVAAVGACAVLACVGVTRASGLPGRRRLPATGPTIPDIGTAVSVPVGEATHRRTP